MMKHGMKIRQGGELMDINAINYIIADFLNHNFEDISGKLSLSEDLYISEEDLNHLMILIQEEFDIETDDTDVENLEFVEDIYRLIEHLE